MLIPSANCQFYMSLIWPPYATLRSEAEEEHIMEELIELASTFGHLIGIHLWSLSDGEYSACHHVMDDDDPNFVADLIQITVKP